MLTISDLEAAAALGVWTTFTERAQQRYDVLAAHAELTAEWTFSVPVARTYPLECRLSKGEKRNRKRLAEVGAVYDLAPAVRAAADVMASKAGEAPPPAPKATAKWVTASVVEDAAAVIGTVFDEAERRDPTHSRAWVALVDGNNHQIDRIQRQFTGAPRPRVPRRWQPGCAPPGCSATTGWGRCRWRGRGPGPSAPRWCRPGRRRRRGSRLR